MSTSFPHPLQTCSGTLLLLLLLLVLLVQSILLWDSLAAPNLSSDTSSSRILFVSQAVSTMLLDPSCLLLASTLLFVRFSLSYHFLLLSFHFLIALPQHKGWDAHLTWSSF